ncbi:MAG: carboxypeptidase-like regulatory domain-containing protein, partial [Bacteroidota bacterium]
MRKLLTLTLALFLCTYLCAQSELPTLNLSDASITRVEALQQINDGLPVRIFFQEDQLPASPISLNLHGATVREALKAILEDTVLDFVDYRDRVYVIGSAITIGTEFDAAYYAAVAEGLEESTPAGATEEATAYIGTLESLGADGMATVSGTITDQSNGESFIGATVQIENSTAAAATDAEGKYELKLRPGAYTMIISYVGFGANRRDIRVNGSGTYDIALGA